ncbi:MAG: phosphatase PAP2 family protein [Chlamydiota bacterium]|nr:phosphatase PAP2 family protein [Chlamydiota bacterium]
MLFITIAPLTPSLDIDIENFFFNQSNFTGNTLFTFIYQYGPYPALVTASLSFVGFITSFFLSSLLPFRKSFALLVLTLAIGSGLIVHIALKEQWGRPRPKQVTEFGGKQEFRPFYSPNFFNQPEPSKSFPCGHCSTGFYFFALALAGKRLKNRKLEVIGYLLAMALGIALSVARMAQGGHFFSDTITAALIMWMTALICDWFIYEWRSE